VQAAGTTIGAGLAEIGFIFESFTSSFSTLRCSCGWARLVCVMLQFSHAVGAEEKHSDCTSRKRCPWPVLPRPPHALGCSVGFAATTGGMASFSIPPFTFHITASRPCTCCRDDAAIVTRKKSRPNREWAAFRCVRGLLSIHSIHLEDRVACQRKARPHQSENVPAQRPINGPPCGRRLQRTRLPTHRAGW
jgi:hypothetical protein